jgi:hypothetical protein
MQYVKQIELSQKICLSSIPIKPHRYLTSNLRTPDIFLTYDYLFSDFHLRIRPLTPKPPLQTNGFPNHHPLAYPTSFRLISTFSLTFTLE